MKKAAQAARMQLEQHIKRLDNAVEQGNKKGAHGGNVFDSRLAILDVEKGRILCQKYALDVSRLESSADQVWQDLMAKEDYELAEIFARSIGI